MTNHKKAKLAEKLLRKNKFKSLIRLIVALTLEIQLKVFKIIYFKC